MPYKQPAIPATSSVIPAQAGIQSPPFTLSLSKGRAPYPTSFPRRRESIPSYPFPLDADLSITLAPAKSLPSCHDTGSGSHPPPLTLSPVLSLSKGRAEGIPSSPFPLDGGKVRACPVLDTGMGV